MVARSLQDVEDIWKNLEGVKKLSDRVIGIGPFGIGLDGMLAWFPVVGQVYTVGAAGWLLTQAVRARANPSTILRMLGYLGLDTAVGSVPILGDAIDTILPAHLMAARALQKDIETTHWVNGSARAAKASGDHDRHAADARAAKRRRVVYFHD
ncbi:MAG TPA: DUF4112 domain-containing protein [Caulobacteraceae bacterium]